ncbi:MAG: hypothetical protein IPF59_03340 [Ignavibacteria bacterium]|nr:hypothetical protein [Ignavibacteria bacterium]
MRGLLSFVVVCLTATFSLGATYRSNTGRTGQCLQGQGADARIVHAE